jgi:hypothetical protein
LVSARDFDHVVALGRSFDRPVQIGPAAIRGRLFGPDLVRVPAVGSEGESKHELDARSELLGLDFRRAPQRHAGRDLERWRVDVIDVHQEGERTGLALCPKAVPVEGRPQGAHDARFASTGGPGASRARDESVELDVPSIFADERAMTPGGVWLLRKDAEPTGQRDAADHECRHEDDHRDAFELGYNARQCAASCPRPRAYKAQ